MPLSAVNIDKSRIDNGATNLPITLTPAEREAIAPKAPEEKQPIWWYVAALVVIAIILIWVILKK